MSWELPISAELPSGKYNINADYRDILDIIVELQNEENTEHERAYISLALFYDHFIKVPEEDYQAAIEFMYRFIACGVEDDNSVPSQIKQIDWQQDAPLIVADINKVASCEIRALKYLHWYSFISFFNGIGEGQLSTVVSIREKRRKRQRLEKWEQEFYRNNKAKVDFKKKYTDAEVQEMERLKGLLGN